MKFSLTKMIQKYGPEFERFKLGFIATMFYITLQTEKVSQLTATLIVFIVFVLPMLILIWENRKEWMKAGDK